MIKKVEGYQTSDGKLFETRRTATKHQAGLDLNAFYSQRGPGGGLRTSFIGFLVNNPGEIFAILSPLMVDDVAEDPQPEAEFPRINPDGYPETSVGPFERAELEEDDARGAWFDAESRGDQAGMDAAQRAEDDARGEMSEEEIEAGTVEPPVELEERGNKYPAKPKKKRK